MMKKVYLHIDNKGRPFYVGKGNKYRVYDAHNRSAQWNEIAKNGFDVIILEDNLTNEKAVDVEEYWIKRIGRIQDGGLLVNKAIGERNKGFFRKNEPRVTYRKDSKTWEVRHSVNGVRKWLGTYKTESEAYDAIKKIK